MTERRFLHTSFVSAGAFLWLSVSLVFPQPVAAQQTSFNKQLNDDELQFDYRWLDAKGQSQQLQFHVDNQSFISSLKRFRNYSLKRANRELNHQLNRYIRQQQWRGVTATLSPRQERIVIETRQAPSRQPQLQQQYNQQAQRLKAYYLQQRQHYLESNFYRQLQLPPGESGIIPDPVGIANEQRDLFRELIQAIGEKLRNNSRRSYVNYVGQFIQAIPYDDLEQNLAARGDGFLPPNQVLLYNRGDCDSKSTLMATLLKPIIPQAPMAIVFLPGHALFAIGMSANDSDATIDVDGRTLVLIEAAGPALMPAGTISDSSQFYIDSGQYTAISIN